MKYFEVKTDLFNRVLAFRALHVRNEGQSTVVFMGQKMPPGATWSHPHNITVGDATTEERLVIQFESKDSTKNSFIINYF